MKRIWGGLLLMLIVALTALAMTSAKTDPEPEVVLFEPPTIDTVLTNAAQLSRAFEEFEWHYP